jgi:hypothetical protein
MAKDNVITVWERQNEKTKNWEHNHISDGYDENQAQPIPNGSVQKKSWPNGKWRKYKAKLVNNVVVNVD